ALDGLAVAHRLLGAVHAVELGPLAQLVAVAVVGGARVLVVAVGGGVARPRAADAPVAGDAVGLEPAPGEEREDDPRDAGQGGEREAELRGLARAAAVRKSVHRGVSPWCGVRRTPNGKDRRQ